MAQRKHFTFPDSDKACAFVSAVKPYVSEVDRFDREVSVRMPRDLAARRKVHELSKRIVDQSMSFSAA